MSVLKDLLPDTDTTEELNFLYDLRDVADSENFSSKDNLDVVQDMIYRRIELLEQQGNENHLHERSASGA